MKFLKFTRKLSDKVIGGRMKTRHYLYRTWSSMRQRCTNPNVHNYSNYGGRGITVCARWQDFENFITDMGERPEGHTLDRINVNKGYSSENCRWASRIVQNNNRRVEIQARSNNLTGRLGLGFNEASGKWRVRRFNQEKTFKTRELAETWLNQLEQQRVF